jgi:pilus assembly protein CpaB
MRSKSLYLLVACICGSVAAVFASQWLNAHADAGRNNMAEIFVAAVDINVGEAINPERIKLEPWPADRIPSGASGDLQALTGKFAKQRFYSGEPIMPVKLMDVNFESVPKGYQTVGLSANGINIARVVQPGDRVDVTAYFPKSDLIERDIVKQVLMGVRVYSLDGDTQRHVGEDRPANVRNIELLIHKDDVEAWTWANELGKIRLSLGSDSDYDQESGSSKVGQEFLTWLEAQRSRHEVTASPVAGGTSTPAVAVTTPEKQAGFVVIKMSEGKMMKYLIVDGELPRLLGEVGGDTDVQEELGADRQYKVTEEDQASDSETDFLHGEDSPFYQPPVDRKSGY